MASLKTITQFKSRLAGGGARPNLFEVNINDFKYADAWDNETFQFLCKSAAMPASSITPVEIPFRGRILKVAGELKQLDEATATATATAAPDATQEPTAAATAAAATNGGMTMGSNESKAGLPPFVPWGNNASAGVTVTASVDGVICTTAVADASGQWFFRLEDGCGNEGATVTFTTSDGRSATSTYKMGEGAMVLFSN